MNPTKEKMYKNLENIKSCFQPSGKTFYTQKELLKLYHNCINNKLIYKQTTRSAFFNILTENSVLKDKFSFEFFNKRHHRYFTINPSIYDLALSISEKAYLSHYTAVYINNLTNNIPKVVFVNTEHSKPLKETEKVMLEQKNIDKAFYSPPRINKNLTSYDKYTINFLNGKYTDCLGVITKKINTQKIRVTDIERTLIDITVSPYYCGGTYEVLNVYKRAKGLFYPQKLAEMLKQLDYIYPYHQAIGFFMEKAGYKEEDLKFFEDFRIDYKFFIERELREKDRNFSQRWNLFYPKFL